MNLFHVIFLDGSVSLRLSSALLHFVWQGTAIGLLFAVADRLLRRRSATAATRYVAACAALATMLVLPVVTYVQASGGGFPPSIHPSISTNATAAGQAVTATTPFSKESGASPGFTGAVRAGRSAIAACLPSLRPWFLAAWLAGVAALSLRFLASCAGVSLLARARGAVPPAFRAEALRKLSERLRITRTVRLLESAAVRVPTALGVLRPVILLPVSALVGLDAAQIEGLLAHELAHVRRHDYLVNLLQSVVETLLFYHPAVWWVSGKIRAERENACDDLAIEATGDRSGYARALVELASLRAGRGLLPPSRRRDLALAADGGELRRRIARLFPHAIPSAADLRSRRAAGAVALTILLASGAAASIAAAASGAAPDRPVPPAIPAAPALPHSPVIPPVPSRPDDTDRIDQDCAAQKAGAAAVVSDGASAPVLAVSSVPAVASVPAVLAGLAEPAVPAVASVPAAAPNAAPPAVAPASSADAEPLPEEDFISLRRHGITPEFLRGLSSLGYRRATETELVALRIHGVEVEDVAEYQKIFPGVSLRDCVSLKTRGVSARWLREVSAVFSPLSVDQAILLAIHGADGAFLARFRQVGYDRLTPDQAVALRVHGVDTADVEALRASGARPSVDELVSARVHGVDAPFVREMRSELPGAGLDELVSLRIHGVTASYLRELKILGMPLSADAAIELRNHGVSLELFREMKALGVAGLDADGLIALRIHGVTTEFVKGLEAEGYAKPSVDELTSLRMHGWTLQMIREANRSAGRRLTVQGLLDGTDPAMRNE